MHGNRKASMPGFMNRTEFGEFIGMSYQRVVALGKTDNPPPFNSDGYIPVEDAGAWLEAHTLATTASTDLERARIRAQIAKDISVARKNEIANEAREAELVEASDAAETWEELKRLATARLLQVPAEAAAVVAAIPLDAPDRQMAIMEALTDVIYAALTDLSKPDEPEDATLPSAPTGAVPPV